MKLPISGKKVITGVLLNLFVSFLFIATIRRLFESFLLFETIFICSLTVSVLQILATRFKFKKLDTTSCLSVLLAFSLVMNLGFLVLMNVERSRSFYILAWVSTPATKVEVVRLSNLSLGSSEYSGIDQRLTEQQNRGLINKTGEVYSLSRSGKVLLGTADVLAKVFNLSTYEMVRGFKLDSQN